MRAVNGSVDGTRRSTVKRVSAMSHEEDGHLDEMGCRVKLWLAFFFLTKINLFFSLCVF